jgi:hypothetical protein
MIGCRQAVPLFIYTLALQPRKSTENFSQVSRAVVELCLRKFVISQPARENRTEHLTS